MIKLTNINKTYTGETSKTQVLKNINFEIDRGEFVTLVGPSGSGKSTLLYIAGGLEPPTSGEVYLKGKSLDKLSDKALSETKRKDMGFVFQFFNLLPHLNVLDNVSLPALIDGRDKKQSKERAQHYLTKFGLGDKLKSLPSQLSGGQQQRVAIARALICDPDIILADEPTGNLDSESSQIVMDLFKMINIEEHKTILMVTHSQDTLIYSTRTVALKDGHILS